MSLEHLRVLCEFGLLCYWAIFFWLLLGFIDFVERWRKIGFTFALYEWWCQIARDFCDALVFLPVIAGLVLLIPGLIFYLLALAGIWLLNLIARKGATGDLKPVEYGIFMLAAVCGAIGAIVMSPGKIFFQRRWKGWWIRIEYCLD